jgi:hypothetical protein
MGGGRKAPFFQRRRRKMAKSKTIIASIICPAGVDMREARQYIQEALRGWGEARPPDDILFQGMIAPKRGMVLFKSNPKVRKAK